MALEISAWEWRMPRAGNPRTGYLAFGRLLDYPGFGMVMNGNRLVKGKGNKYQRHRTPSGRETCPPAPFLQKQARLIPGS